MMRGVAVLVAVGGYLCGTYLTFGTEYLVIILAAIGVGIKKSIDDSAVALDIQRSQNNWLIETLNWKVFLFFVGGIIIGKVASFVALGSNEGWSSISIYEILKGAFTFSR